MGEHFNDFVNRQVAQGRYGSASEVVRAGLHLLEGHELRVETLRAALIEGEDSGLPREFDRNAFLTRLNGIRVADE